MHLMTASAVATLLDLSSYVPTSLRHLSDPQRDLPRIAKDPKLVAEIETSLKSLPTQHRLQLQDSRFMSNIEPESVHLVLTSPPYWTLKEYRESEGQMGAIANYEGFLSELAKVWRHCFEALVPGGRLICVVG
jgi:tRNA1(Val) A37 N6-methylase TrmN6